MQPLVTFMIATRNRVSELEKTLASCFEQDWPALEVIVVDDASTDGTSELVRTKFPRVELIRHEKNRGSIASRNTIIRRAKGEYIIGLDDDSRFIEPDGCRRVVERLEAEPDLGIISLQAIGPENPASLTPDGRLSGEWHCSSFAACAVALRRSLLETTGPLEELFYHSYEEPDLCLRAWDAGYRVLQWNDVIVYHEFSGLNRNEARNHRRHSRNEACAALLRAPWHLAVPLAAGRLFRQFRYAVRRGWGWQEPKMWAETLLYVPAALRRRRPVSARALKIALAVNRWRVDDPEAVWRLGELPWRTILAGVGDVVPVGVRPVRSPSQTTRGNGGTRSQSEPNGTVGAAPALTDPALQK
jgi:GT2 family glycosyltransferase